MKPEPIEGERVRLRLYRDSDVPDLVAACADPEIRRFLPLLPHPVTEADARWWIGEGSPTAWREGGAAYAIADPATDRLLGAVGINHLVPVRRQGEVGYWVAPWARGRGVATEATRLLAAAAFGAELSRLELLTHPENVASQRVALAAGFQREGVRRGAVLGPEGGRHDRVLWARLASDPPGPVRRLLPDLPGGQLTDGVVTLRPLAAQDVEAIYELHSLPDVVATSVPPVAPDRTEIEARCAHSASRWLAGERADLVIQDAATGAVAGDIGLYYQEPQTGQAMIGYSMLPGWRGRGYASRAARLVARWAFGTVGIARLVAGTLPTNVGSQRVLEKAGFRREGFQRDRLPSTGGGRVDDVLFALLPGDLTSARPSRTSASI
ncbi:MAG TPA: GNAT family N-acetyltransferase [Micromonosporaceae bacterium]